MVMKFSHIVFDWDGTLMDSANKIVSCMQSAAASANLPIPADKEVKNIIGISLIPAIQRLFDIDVKQSEEVSLYYKTAFIKADHIPCPLFDTVTETLSDLQNHCTLGVATGKARRGLERAWHACNLAPYFDASRCADEALSKPSPDMLLQLLNQWQVDAENVLMVGDTVYDMQMAETINMPRLAVSYGVHKAERLLKHEPIGIIDCFSEIKQYLR